MGTLQQQDAPGITAYRFTQDCRIGARRAIANGTVSALNHSHVVEAFPVTDCLSGVRSYVENTFHSSAATAAYVFPSADASNIARKHRVVTGANATRLNALATLVYGVVALTAFQLSPSRYFQSPHVRQRHTSARSDC